MLKKEDELQISYLDSESSSNEISPVREAKAAAAKRREEDRKRTRDLVEEIKRGLANSFADEESSNVGEERKQNEGERAPTDVRDLLAEVERIFANSDNQQDAPEVVPPHRT